MSLHVIQRGNNRNATFRSAADYKRYRGILYEASQRAQCKVHAYVLMTNHLHMLITPEDADGPSRMMQAIGSKYVFYVNGRVPRTGTLWEGRYRSSLVNSDRYFFACTRYIELNPVRAQVTDDPGRYSATTIFDGKSRSLCNVRYRGDFGVATAAAKLSGQSKATAGAQRLRTFKGSDPLIGCVQGL